MSYYFYTLILLYRQYMVVLLNKTATTKKPLLDVRSQTYMIKSLVLYNNILQNFYT